ncbi:zinc-ribbon domain-containing protein [Candidatus Pelagibacter communis]|uniref:zinc-ribbon domain-containing protein n=1 Tax=Pelagibacter ubique TaxID=198252 RepID=UPI00092CE2CF|nr:zinc-ribbon domain-containing protein [Candidatus Pelagibacter ubique]
MIITCPNCNKQFKIDNSLISDEGRDLQCGSCNHIWFYKIEEENNEVLNLNDEIVKEEIETEAEKKEENITTEINYKKKEKTSEKQKNNNASKNTSTKVSKFFSYLIVFIISFVALIILLDTLKTPLINVFPALEIILFNLFETLQDIKLFIIDLI